MVSKFVYAYRCNTECALVWLAHLYIIVSMIWHAYLYNTECDPALQIYTAFNRTMSWLASSCMSVLLSHNVQIYGTHTAALIWLANLYEILYDPRLSCKCTHNSKWRWYNVQFCVNFSVVIHRTIQFVIKCDHDTAENVQAASYGLTSIDRAVRYITLFLHNGSYSAPFLRKVWTLDMLMNFIHDVWTHSGP